MGRVYQTISPDTGTTTYTYDPAGNMTTKTDAKGVTATYTFDAANRLTQISFPDPVDNVSYGYDACINGKGRLCSMVDASGTTSYEYTPKAQVRKETKISDGVTYVTQYSYDQNGNLKTMTYPSGRVITYNYSNNHVVSVQNNVASLATSINYKPFGGISSLTFGNGIVGSTGYDNQYRVASISAGSVMNLSYAEDANGNITAINNILDPPKNKAHLYDALDRLTTATGSWGSLGWTYDGVGNRLTEGANSYAYLANSNILNSANGLSYGYDNNGNTTAEGSRTYTYNKNQRLIRVVDAGVTKGEYTFNGNGQRVNKVVNGVTTVFHYNLAGQPIAESDNAGTITAEYVYLYGQALAKIEGTAVYYYHNDHLDTPQKMTDSTGTVVWSADYKPFGEVTVDPASTVANNLRFPGQYFDAETGLHYNYFRDYNPVTGRYVEADLIGLDGGVNLYAYVQNNSVNYIDPLGLDSKRIKIGGKIYDYHLNDHHGVNPAEIHVHDLETGEKIGVETGTIYDIKGKKICGNIGKKALTGLRKALRGLGYLSYLGYILTAIETYNMATADDAQALENILAIADKLPQERRNLFLQDIIARNPNKFREVRQ